jgi:hypothetical protein
MLSLIYWGMIQPLQANIKKTPVNINVIKAKIGNPLPLQAIFPESLDPPRQKSYRSYLLPCVFNL